jgi:hypothetical protein
MVWPGEVKSLWRSWPRGDTQSPFRTWKLSPGTAMVLHSRGCGRVARRHFKRHGGAFGPPFFIPARYDKKSKQAGHDSEAPRPSGACCDHRLPCTTCIPRPCDRALSHVTQVTDRTRRSQAAAAPHNGDGLLRLYSRETAARLPNQ